MSGGEDGASPDILTVAAAAYSRTVPTDGRQGAPFWEPLSSIGSGLRTGEVHGWDVRILDGEALGA